MKILETERLILRHLTLDDLDALFAIYSNAEVVRFIPDVSTTVEETKEEIEWFQHGHPKHPELGLWATVYKETGQLIGRCGLLPWEINGRSEVEIAYLLDEPFWGQGLATEAAIAIRDYARSQLGLTRLVCLIEAENVASVRVAEKLGMAFEQEGEDEIGPFHLYAMG